MTLSVSRVCELIGSLIRSHGYKKSSYWLDAEAISALNSRPFPLWEAEVRAERGPGHYGRRTGAKALLAGAEVTLDIGYSGELDSNAPHITVTLADLLEEN